jgi:hypothetical protein
MKLELVIIRILLAMIGFSLALGLSRRVIKDSQVQNRAAEWPEMEKGDPIKKPILDWTLVHIRDDLGSLHNLIPITNGLLAAILGALIF